MSTTRSRGRPKKIEEEPILTASKPTAITNCQFTGVQFDAKAVNAIEKIAEGLIENAKGFRSLAEVLKASNVTIESMVKIEGTK